VVVVVEYLVFFVCLWGWLLFEWCVSLIIVDFVMWVGDVGMVLVLVKEVVVWVCDIGDVYFEVCSVFVFVIVVLVIGDFVLICMEGLYSIWLLL